MDTSELTDEELRRMVYIRTFYNLLTVQVLKQKPKTNMTFFWDPINGDPINRDPINGCPINGDPINGEFSIK